MTQLFRRLTFFLTVHNIVLTQFKFKINPNCTHRNPFTLGKSGRNVLLLLGTFSHPSKHHPIEEIIQIAPELEVASTSIVS